MTSRDFEDIYRFEITTRLRPLVSAGGSDPGALRDLPGGRRYYLEYADGRVASPRLEERSLGDRAEAFFQRAFGKPLPALTDADARALEGCRDPELRELILGEIRSAQAGDLCADPRGLQAFLQRFTRPDHLRRARGPLARRVVEATGAEIGLEGGIISSGDWAFLRQDGVFCLDGRFTIQAVDGTLISANLLARADLREGLGGGPDLETYQRWQEGALASDRCSLPLHGLLRFEVPGDPGPRADFAAPRWLRAGGCFWKYQHLARGLFLGVGALTLDRRSGSAETGHATALLLSVHEVKPRMGALEARDQPLAAA
jgi:hypothetical protein